MRLFSSKVEVYRNGKFVYKISVGPDAFRWFNRKDKIHREDGPALITSDFRCFRWFKHGKSHRTGGPASMYGYNPQYSFLNPYNISPLSPVGPSVSYWCQNDKNHNTNGPAVVRVIYALGMSSVSKAYWINGHHYTTDDKYQKARDHWLSYQEVTRDEIRHVIGNFKIVNW